MEMLAEILKTYKVRLAVTYSPETRIEVIKAMKAELILMKETYEAINGPTKPNKATFEELVKQLSN